MVGPIELLTRSPDETRKTAAAIAELFSPGDVVSLAGDLGAGKTAFVQGAARALGVDETVASPTFVLVREYRADLPIVHVDVYRLNRMQDVLDLGFEDLLDPRSVVFIEWGDSIRALLPDSHLRVELLIEEDGEVRRLRFRGHGDLWVARWERVEAALGPWRVA